MSSGHRSCADRSGAKTGGILMVGRKPKLTAMKELEGKVADMYRNGYYVEKDQQKYEQIIEDLYPKVKDMMSLILFRRYSPGLQG